MPEVNIWFAFTNKKRIAVKIISLDSTGYWLATKYFAKGKLAFWPSGHATVTTLSAEQLELIINQKHPIAAQYVRHLGLSSGLFTE